MRLFIFLFIFVIISLNVVEAQTLKALHNANGEEILIHEDSCFFSILNTGLLFYGESQGTGLRNFYFTNGDTTIALLPNEISNSVPIAKPIEKLYKEEFIFRAGDVWYKTKGSPATTSIFYDNSAENNPYQYELIYSSSKGDFTGPHLLIVAIEKSSQDTVTLFHNSNTGSTSPFQQSIRIFDGPFYGAGQFIGNYFIASIYDEVVGAWSPVSIYRVHGTTWKPVLSIENRPFNKAERVSFSSWELLTFKNLDGSLDAFSYNGKSDSFVPFTFFTNQNLRLFDIKNVKSPYFGYPDVLPIDYNAYYYSVKSGNGPLKYYYEGSIEDVELKNLENSIGCDFIGRPVNEDTILFYNYSDPSAGLIRYSKLNRNYKKDNSIIPFDTSFQLKGFMDNLYFGDYNPNSGKIEAVFKDLETEEYHIIESSNGTRVENPINFQFFNDKVFIYNRREDGIRVIVFDPDATTSTGKEPHSIPLFTIYPNPASDHLEISIGERFQYPSDSKFRIIDSRGIEVKADNINGSSCIVDVKDLSPGMYYVQVLDNARLIQTTTVSISR